MTKIIVGNWKLNPLTPREAKALLAKIKTKTPDSKKVRVVICPPAVYLSLFDGGRLGNLSFGAQDAFWEDEGAYTGQISMPMVKYVGAMYVIIGHSERRACGETNKMINAKVKKALKAGLQIILCIGEKERDPNGHYLEFIKQQIEESLAGLKKQNLKNLTIAYEPVWAIGKEAKSADTPAEFIHNALFIKKILSKMFGKKEALSVSILYGGSVNKKNAAEFLTAGQADGLLVGRASLDPDQFGAIIKIAANL